MDWSRFNHAYGPATDVPALIRGLASPEASIRESAQWCLYGNIFHQGSRYEAALPAIPFLIELLEAPEVPDKPWLISYLLALAIGYASDYLPRGYEIIKLRKIFEFGPIPEEELKNFHDPEAYRRALKFDLDLYDAVRKCIPTIIDFAQSSDIETRQKAVCALAWFPEEATLSLPILRNILQTSTDLDLKANALIAIGLIGQDLPSDQFAKHIELMSSNLLKLKNVGIRTCAFLSICTLKKAIPPNLIPIVLELMEALEFVPEYSMCQYYGVELIVYFTRVLETFEPQIPPDLLPRLLYLYPRIGIDNAIPIGHWLLNLLAKYGLPDLDNKKKSLAKESSQILVTLAWGEAWDKWDFTVRLKKLGLPDSQETYVKKCLDWGLGDEILSLCRKQIEDKECNLEPILSLTQLFLKKEGEEQYAKNLADLVIRGGKIRGDKGIIRKSRAILFQIQERRGVLEELPFDENVMPLFYLQRVPKAELANRLLIKLFGTPPFRKKLLTTDQTKLLTIIWLQPRNLTEFGLETNLAESLQKFEIPNKQEDFIDFVIDRGERLTIISMAIHIMSLDLDLQNHVLVKFWSLEKKQGEILELLLNQLTGSSNEIFRAIGKVLLNVRKSTPIPTLNLELFSFLTFAFRNLDSWMVALVTDWVFERFFGDPNYCRDLFSGKKYLKSLTPDQIHFLYILLDGYIMAEDVIIAVHLEKWSVPPNEDAFAKLLCKLGLGPSYLESRAENLEFLEKVWPLLNKVGYQLIFEPEFTSNALEIGKWLERTGEKLENLSMELFGKDIQAVILAQSPLKTDLKRAIKIFESIKTIDDSCFSEDVYQQTLDKLAKINQSN